MATATWQPSLLDLDTPTGFDPTFDGARRRFLGHGAWVDVVPGWVRGADALFEQVLDAARGSRAPGRMWDNGRRRAAPDDRRLGRAAGAAAGDGRRALGPLRLDLSAVSANLYRDGADSVAWHGDTSGRQRETTVVAILSLGEPRRFLLRPKGGGARRSATRRPAATCSCSAAPASARSTTRCRRAAPPAPASR